MMDLIEKSIANGECSIAISHSLLKDPESFLELSRRSALIPMALSGPAQAPLLAVSPKGLARALSKPTGLLVIVDPQDSDKPGLAELGRLVQGAKNKPKVIVVGRQFNPFTFGSFFQGHALEHLKARGKSFLKQLPEPPSLESTPVPVIVKDKTKKDGGAIVPKLTFSGRTDELTQLREMLNTGGPIIISGPPGVGKRSLIEHAIAGSELERLPDLVIGRGCGADTLAARIAELTKLAGQEDLASALRGKSTPVEVEKALITSIEGASGAENQVMVIHNLQYVLSRRHDFFKMSRIEMLIRALLTHSYPLRLIFVSSMQPRFSRENDGSHLRRVEIGGLSENAAHKIFEAYQVPEQTTETIKAVVERTHGHPMAIQFAAIALRNNKKGVALLEEKNFLNMKHLGDMDPLQRQIKKVLGKSSKAERASLSLMAHFRFVTDAATLSKLGVNRTVRAGLLSKGLLTRVGTETSQKFLLHPLLREQLSFREVSDFEIMQELGEYYGGLAKNSEGVEKLAYVQEYNRYAVSGREDKPTLLRSDYPDNDAALHRCGGFIRSKKPRMDLFAGSIGALLKMAPNNADVHLLYLEALSQDESKKSEMRVAFNTAVEKAPVPELFHQAATFSLKSRARNQAVKTLQKGIELMPQESRFHTRLASLLVEMQRRSKAIGHLKTAIELNPKSANAYSLLGELKRAEGASTLKESESYLRTAVKLVPQDPIHVARLAELLLARAQVEEDVAADLRKETRTMLKRVLKDEWRAAEAFFQMAILERLENGEHTLRYKYLKRAERFSDRKSDRHHRVALERVHVKISEGLLDDAENAVREACRKNPSSHLAFSTLADVLAAKELFIPAHAEYLRARERASQYSLAHRIYESRISEIQQIIESQAAVMIAKSTEVKPKKSSKSTPKPKKENVGHQRTIRRKKMKGATPGQMPSTGNALREWREAQGLSLADLADQLGVSETTVGRGEKCGEKPLPKVWTSRLTPLFGA